LFKTFSNSNLEHLVHAATPLVPNSMATSLIVQNIIISSGWFLDLKQEFNDCQRSKYCKKIQRR
jgi:hypothetical protein